MVRLGRQFTERLKSCCSKGGSKENAHDVGSAAGLRSI
jgi:hypothetical protein